MLSDLQAVQRLGYCALILNGYSLLNSAVLSLALELMDELGPVGVGSAPHQRWLNNVKVTYDDLAAIYEGDVKLHRVFRGEAEDRVLLTRLGRAIAKLHADVLCALAELPTDESAAKRKIRSIGLAAKKIGEDAVFDYRLARDRFLEAQQAMEAAEARARAAEADARAAEQAEKQRRAEELRRLMARYIDPFVLDMLNVDPSLLTLKEKGITICFWDIRDFTKLCTILTAHPNLIAGFLKEYGEVAVKCIRDNGGVVDKFIGDGVMALFGLTATRSDETDRGAGNAVLAAIDFRAQFAETFRKWSQKWSLNVNEDIMIGLGCGINAQAALVGNAGSDAHDQFTALGPAVNLASRIEGKSLSGKILISNTTKTYLQQCYGLDSPSAKIHDEVHIAIKDVKIRLHFAGVIDDMKNLPGRFRVYEVELE